MNESTRRERKCSGPDSNGGCRGALIWFQSGQSSETSGFKGLRRAAVRGGARHDCHRQNPDLTSKEDLLPASDPNGPCSPGGSPLEGSFKAPGTNEERVHCIEKKKKNPRGEENEWNSRRVVTKLPNLFFPDYPSVASWGILIFDSLFWRGVHCLCCIVAAKVRHQRVNREEDGGNGGWVGDMGGGLGRLGRRQESNLFSAAFVALL